MMPLSMLGCEELSCFKGNIGCFHPMLPLSTLGCGELPHFKGNIGCVHPKVCLIIITGKFYILPLP
jgi:hypothetical protein